MKKKTSSPVLDALFVLEEHLRALPRERRASAIDLAVSRLRRLKPGRSCQAAEPDPAQLDLERELEREPRKP